MATEVKINKFQIDIINMSANITLQISGSMGDFKEFKKMTEEEQDSYLGKNLRLALAAFQKTN